MKIQSIETFCNEFVGMVRLTTDEGLQGWGQVSPYNSDISALVLHRQVAPHAVGQNVPATEDILGFVHGIYEREHKWPGSYMCRALGGLDTALWDLHGKLQQRSVCELLGGTPRDFPVYASSMRRDISPEDEAARFLKLKEQCGYTAFKFRVGKECGHDEDEWPGRSEAVVSKVRQALGEDVALLVDGNSCYTPERAIEVGKMLQDYGVCHFEEPCPYWEYEWTKQVTDSLELDVTGGEQDNSLALWKKIVNERVVNVIQPDICYLGGLSRTLEVVKMGAEAGLLCTPHSANLSMVTVFTLHMMGAIENAGPYVEFSIEDEIDYYPWQKGLFTEPLVASEGKVAIPDGPGWGVEINPQWLESSYYQITEFS